MDNPRHLGGGFSLEYFPIEGLNQILILIKYAIFIFIDTHSYILIK